MLPSPHEWLVPPFGYSCKFGAIGPGQKQGSREIVTAWNPLHSATRGPRYRRRWFPAARGLVRGGIAITFIVWRTILESREPSASSIETEITPEAMIARVLSDAQRSYGDRIDANTLSIWAESAVKEVWGESVKITSFVPVLALRRIREVAETYHSPGMT